MQKMESKAVDHYFTPRERPMDKMNKQETAVSCNQTHKRQRSLTRDEPNLDLHLGQSLSELGQCI